MRFLLDCRGWISAASAAEAALCRRKPPPRLPPEESAAAKAAAIAEAPDLDPPPKLPPEGPLTRRSRRTGPVRPGRTGRCGPGRTGTAAHGSTHGTAGTPRGRGGQGAGPAAPENGIVHRPAHHSRTPAIAVVAHAVQQRPNHENAHDQQHHTGDADAGGAGRLLPALARSRGLTAGICAAQGTGPAPRRSGGRNSPLPGNNPRHSRGCPGRFSAGSAGVGHQVRQVVAAGHIPVAALDQEQQHIVGSQAPPGPQLPGIVLAGPARISSTAATATTA